MTECPTATGAFVAMHFHRSDPGVFDFSCPMSPSLKDPPFAVWAFFGPFGFVAFYFAKLQYNHIEGSLFSVVLSNYILQETFFLFQYPPFL